jgi:hypothetical protein
MPQIFSPGTNTVFRTVSLGATSIFEQASILTLYDPDRSKTISHDGQIETWDNLVSAWLTEQERHLASDGKALGFLLDSNISPTLAWPWQIGELQKRYPAAKWYHWEPISRETIIEGCGTIHCEENNSSLFSRLLSLIERAERDDKIGAHVRKAKRRLRIASRVSFSRYVE